MARDWSKQWLKGWALTWPELIAALCVFVGLIVACIVCRLCSSAAPGHRVEPGKTVGGERENQGEALKNREAEGLAERSGAGER